MLRFAALLLNTVVDQHGTLNDFIGHAGNEIFIVITESERVDAMVAELRRRFDEESRTHYNFMDLEQGGIRLNDGQLAPFMRLSAGVVRAGSQPFSDIREITETAAELRRQN